MTELLELMKEKHLWTMEELAIQLNTTSIDIKRQVEYLEHIGMLKRISKCSENCSGCSVHCNRLGELTGIPEFWIVTYHE